VSSFKSPARVRFPRSNVTGNRPDTLAAGSLAVNWADKVIWVGDARGEAVRFTQKIEDWRGTKVYAIDDLVIFEGDLYRCNQIQNPQPFDPNAWDRLTDSTRALFNEPVSSDILSGGQVLPFVGTIIEIRAGSGVIVDNTDIRNEVPKVVTWPNLTFAATPPAEPWSIIGIDKAGVIREVAASGYTAQFRRDHIELAFVLWQSNPSTIALVLDASVRAGGTAETQRDEYNVNGGAYRASGVRPAAIPTTLGFSLTDGQVFALGWNWRADPKNPNVLDIPPIPQVEFIRVTQTGSVSGIETAIDPDQWDNAGVLAPVAAGEVTIQYIYALPDLSQMFVQYGQAVYPTAASAADALVDDYEASALVLEIEPLMVIGAIIVAEGTTDLSTARIVNAQRGASPFGDITELQDSDFYLLDGSRPLQGAMNANNNEILDVILDGGVMA
jgi:hypothetical protein